MKAAIKFIEPNNKLAILTRLLDIIQDIEQLKQHILTHGILLEKLSGAEVGALKKALRKLDYSDYTATESSLRLKIARGDLSSLIRLVITIPGFENDFAEMFWKRGFTVEKLLSDQAEDLKRRLGTIAIVTITPDIADTPEPVVYTVSGQVRKQDDTPFTESGFTVHAFDSVSPNNLVELGLVVLNSQPSYHLSYSWISDGRSGPNLVVRLVNPEGETVTEVRHSLAPAQTVLNITVKNQQPQSFILTAHVKNQATGAVLPNVQVEAQFRTSDMILLIQSGTTDAKGTALLPFDETLFYKAPTDQKVDVVFQVQKAGERLATTTTIPNLQPEDQRVELIVSLPRSSEENFVVRGTIRQADASPSIGTPVQAFDKDMLRNEKLGEQQTDQDGRYSILYTRSQFTRAEKTSADLFIVVSLPNAPQIMLAESEVVFHARRTETIDLTIHRNPSEFERYKATLDQLREDRSIADLTTENVEFCAKETGIPLQHIQFLVAAFQLFQQTPLESEVFYAIGRELDISPLSLTALAQLDKETIREALEKAQNSNIVQFQQDIASILTKLLLLLGKGDHKTLPEPILTHDDVLSLHEEAELTPAAIKEKNPNLFKQLVKKAIHSLHQSLITHFETATFELRHLLRVTDFATIATPGKTVQSILSDAIRKSRLSDPIKREGLIKIEDWSGAATLDEILQPAAALGTNPLFHNELRVAGVLLVSSLAQLSIDKIEVLLNEGFGLDDVDLDNLKALVEKGLLSDAESQEFGLNANLYQFASSNLNLVNSIKKLGVSHQTEGLKNLAVLSRGDWEELLERDKISPPDNSSRAKYAALLQKQVEVLYPQDVFLSGHRPIDENSFKKNLEIIVPLFRQNNLRFNGEPFSTLNLDNIDSQTLPTVEGAYADLSRWVNRYPGLELNDVLRNQQSSPTNKLAETQRRVNLIEQFYKLNASVPFLSLDYSPKSKDHEQLNLKNFKANDQRLILNNLKADQRIYRITHDSEHTYRLKEAGYQAAYQIASDSWGTFVRKTNLPIPIARQYYLNAEALTVGGGNKFGIFLDLIKDPLDGTPTDNVSPEVRSYLQQLEGYSTFFGEQDYCKCKHCQSIISPAAYFVDLMVFLKKNVLDEHFTGAKASHVLNPYNRRPDLWSLPLTCESTHALVPYLAIILEVLENYIARGSGVDLANRDSVEGLVYRTLYDRAEVNHFQQPFCLPLVELQTYLQHFPISRAEISNILLAYREDVAEVIPQAELGVSRREYALIKSPPLTPEGQLDNRFLTDLYRFDVSIPSEPESKNLLSVMELSREQLTDLVNTKFVTANGTSRITFKGMRRDRDGGLQPDMEVMQGLIPESLDRMHRFTRLWRRLDWSIPELDLVLQYLSNRLLLSTITQLHSLQRKLEISVEELCALFDRIPNEGEDSLCDRLFNLPVFIRSRSGAEGRKWPSDEAFQFPYPTTSVDHVATQQLHRLMAGLGLKDDELFQLIENLRLPLGGAGSTSFSFPLNLDNLSLLYRHARLAKLLKFGIHELFALIRMKRINNVADLNTLQAALSITEWQEKSGYTIRDLADILGDAYGETNNQASSRISPNEFSQSLVDQILADQSLIFKDTLFAHFEGVTEAQSRAIVQANSAVIVPADIRTYRIAASVSDSSGVIISIPSEVRDSLVDAEETQLDLVIREIIVTNRQAGAPNISDRILAATVDLALQDARAVINANPTIFEPVDSSYFWLSPDFASTRSLSIPDGVPLREEAARNYLRQFHAPVVLAYQLARQFSFPVRKIEILSLLAGYDFESSSLGNILTLILHGQSDLSQLIDLVAAVRKLGLWFKDKAFDEQILAFIRTQSGTDKIFHISIEDYRKPSLPHVEQTVRFLQLLKGLQVPAKPDDLFSSLLEFDLASHRFRPGGVRNLRAALGAEEGLINSLNNTDLLPTFSDITTGDPVNRALDALDKLYNCVKLAQYLGIGGEALPMMLSESYDDLHQAATAIVTAIRNKYESEEDYQEIIGPFEDKIREQKRDTLTHYLIHSLVPKIFKSQNDLYHYFVIDTQLEGCSRTSRVVAAISSVQLYVQRCLMNLEQSEDRYIHVLPENIPANEWEWRKNYRLWEANYKVFLYPEIYIEPDLRDDKTPLFEELESELLQREINIQSVLDSYAKYMSGFEEVAGLSIAGAYHDLDQDFAGAYPHLHPSTAKGADILHLFGVTSGEPPQYYYRTVENIYKSEVKGSAKGIAWNAWRKINLQIPVRKVSPIVFLGQLHVLWLEISTRPKNDLVNGSNRFSGYQHTLSLKLSTLRLDNTWTTPQKVRLENNVPFSEGNGVISDPIIEPFEIYTFNENVLFPDRRNTGVTVARPASAEIETRRVHSRNDEATAFLNRILELTKENDDVLNRSSEVVRIIFEGSNGKIAVDKQIDFTSTATRNLFIPKYDTNIHLEPLNGYTLRSYKWDQVYPSLRGTATLALIGVTGMKPAREMDVNLDLYRLEIGDQYRSNYAYLRNKAPAYRRLQLHESAAGRLIKFGYIEDYSAGAAYADAVKILHNQVSYSSIRGFLSTVGSVSAAYPLELSIINGSLTDGIFEVNNIEVNKDILYLHSLPNEDVYVLKRLGTTLSGTARKILFESGISGLLNLTTQQELVEADIRIDLSDDVFNDAKKATERGMPDFTGSLGVYYREIFFHIPFLIANHLNSQGNYADAQHWYHYIFDPTSNELPPGLDRITDSEERKKHQAKRVWRYIEFHNHALETLRQQLNDRVAEEAHKNDPFNPHAIARLRLGAYKKSVVMKYIDNLLDWGDQLFGRDTVESINEATLLYVMAAEILGPRPVELGDCREQGAGESLTFDRISSGINAPRPQAYISEIETVAAGLQMKNRTRANPSASGINSSKVLRNVKWAASKQMISFPNQQSSVIKEGSFGGFATTNFKPLQGLSNSISASPEHQGDISSFFMGSDWTKYDRKRRFPPLASFNTSILNQAQLFCIPQNPDLLGYWNRVEDRLYKIRNCMNISGHRRELSLFAPEIDPRLLVRARAAGIPLEDVLNSISGDLPPYRFSFLIIKAKEYAAPLQSFGAALLGAIEKKDAEELAYLRVVHQDTLLKLTSKLRDLEIAAAEANREVLLRRKTILENRRAYYQSLVDRGLNSGESEQLDLMNASFAIDFMASPLYIASAIIGAIPRRVGTSSSTGTEEGAEALKFFAESIRTISNIMQRRAGIAGIKGSYDRRKQGWVFNLQQTSDELKENQKQIEANEIRLNIARESAQIHEKTLEQSQEVYEFYQDKFTNLGLYTWLSTQLLRLYREAYQDALTVKRLVARAFRFERGDDAMVLSDDQYWDTTHSGLLAGERLMSDLRDMERRYMETHYRSLEIDQAFSLTQIDPAALIKLKETGECSFSIPELYFDLFYPGHYRRRMKSARLTIPCITGPYTNVSATLTLTGSRIRKDPLPAAENLLDVPPTRSVSIATSTAQNDSGVFRLDFRDERYMPFEGAGAVSMWSLSLPKTFRQFDYQTINDVILHISYTSEVDEVFRQQIEGRNLEAESVIRNSLKEQAFPRIFSLRQEFSNPYNRLLRSAIGEPVKIQFTEKRFPLFMQGTILENLNITDAKLVLVVDEDQSVDNFSIAINDIRRPSDDVRFERDPLLGDLPSTDISNVFTGKLTESLLGRQGEPREHTFTVNNAGRLAPDSPTPADPSAIDPEKLRDILIFIEYRLT